HYDPRTIGGGKANVACVCVCVCVCFMRECVRVCVCVCVCEAPLYDQTPERKDRTLEEWRDVCVCVCVWVCEGVRVCVCGCVGVCGGGGWVGVWGCVRVG